MQPRLNRKHTVVAGDTLWKLAEDNYGDRNLVCSCPPVEAFA